MAHRHASHAVHGAHVRAHAKRVPATPTALPLAATRPPVVVPSPGEPVHPLIDPAHEPSDKIRSDGNVPGLTPRQQADRIVASVLAGGTEGPVLLCMPGTNGAAWQSSMLETAHEFIARWHNRGPMAVVSVPYHNGIGDIVKRFFGIGAKESDSVLAMVIKDIHAKAPNRPILVAGESQGSWVISHDLQDKQLAADVTRVIMFAKPGFQAAPAYGTIGTAAAGAKQLAGSTGLVEIRHTDDIVPSLFSHLGGDVLRGYFEAFRRMLVNPDFEYIPHHYDFHGAEAAAYLIDGIVPKSWVHSSKDDL